MKNHLIQIGFFGADDIHKKRLMTHICPTYKYTINKYDKTFNIQLKNLTNISSDFFDIHCICMVFDVNNPNSFKHIELNYDTIDESIALRTISSECSFLLIGITNDKISDKLYKQIIDFTNAKRLMYVTVTNNDYTDFKKMYDQILKMNFLENISLHYGCVVV